MRFFILFLLSINVCFAQPETFREAKKILKNIYGVSNKTFYCNCNYRGKKVDKESCGYQGKIKKGKEMYSKRSNRIEWEHIFPVSKAIGAFKKCNKNGKKLSRKKCLKVSKEFRELEANLFNLVPAVGSLNAVRRNYSYAEISGEIREWGRCDFEKVGRKVEPQDSVKGDIARIYYYLDQKYPFVGVISKKNKKLFDSWNRMDPISDQEKRINCLKAKYQGHSNPFVGECP